MQILGVTCKWNVPNALSVLRILLIPVFMVLYILHYDVWAFVVLFISGLTDCLDGVIARKFNQITDCGKLLDPVSDKLTQVGVVICLNTRYPQLLPLTILCLVKEACQTIGSLLMLKQKFTVRGAKWFGKLSTIVFSASMLASVLFSEHLEPWALWALIGAAGVCMLIAFVGYMGIFIRVVQERKRQKENSSIPASESEKG